MTLTNTTLLILINNFFQLTRNYCNKEIYIYTLRVDCGERFGVAANNGRSLSAHYCQN